MRITSLLVFLSLLSNCSLNEESQFWTEDTIKKKEEKKMTKDQAAKKILMLKRKELIIVKQLPLFRE